MTPTEIDDMAIAEMKREMGGAWLESSWDIASPWVKDRLRIKALAKGLGANKEQNGLLLERVWNEGWEAGCNDQQYGDENAEPWTPNPYGVETRFGSRAS